MNTRGWRFRLAYVITPLAFGAAGFLFVASAISSAGIDLRAERQTDLRGLVQSRAQHNLALAEEVSDLRDEVDDLSDQVAGSGGEEAQRRVDALTSPVGLTAFEGEGVVVTLDDARWPGGERPEGVAADALIVHQQDIQAVVNALWAGGAEAMLIQGQRVISTSAIRCVGNSVVLHSVPYPPPYVIEAIGPVEGMTTALGESPGVRLYLDYVDRFGLGYQFEQRSQITVPAFEGSLELGYARAVTEETDQP